MSNVSKTVSYIKLISGEWIVGSLANIDEFGIVVVFPMTEHLTSMFLQNCDTQIFQFTHNDYIIVKQANESICDRWDSFIKYRYKEDYLTYQNELEKKTLESIYQQDKEKITIH